MAQTRMKWIHDLLIIMLNHLAVIAFPITIMAFSKKQNPYFLFWGITVLLPVILYIIRKYVNVHLLFYGIHILFFVGSCFLPAELMVRILFAGVTFFYLVWSCYLKMKLNGQEARLLMPTFFVLIVGVFALLADTQTEGAYKQYYFILTFLYFAGYFLSHYMDNYIEFITLSKLSATNIPEKTIFKAGIKQTILLSASGIVVVAMGVVFGWFTKIERWLQSMLPKSSNGQEIDIEESFDIKEPVGEGLGEALENALQKEPSELVQNIMAVVRTLLIGFCCILFIVAAVYVIFRCYRFLREHFHVSRKKVVIQKENGDIREKFVIESNSQKKKRDRRILLNRRDKVRKIYKGTMLKAKEALVGKLGERQLGYLTAKECCEKLQADQLRQIYEKSRYSQEEITAEDLNLAKESK